MWKVAVFHSKQGGSVTGKILRMLGMGAKRNPKRASEFSGGPFYQDIIFMRPVYRTEMAVLGLLAA